MLDFITLVFVSILTFIICCDLFCYSKLTFTFVSNFVFIILYFFLRRLPICIRLTKLESIPDFMYSIISLQIIFLFFFQIIIPVFLDMERETLKASVTCLFSLRSKVQYQNSGIDCLILLFSSLHPTAFHVWDLLIKAKSFRYVLQNESKARF